MGLRFTKMHGLGNDYVYVNLFEERVPEPERLAPLISDRHRGVGSDGLILIAPPEGAAADVRMIMYNADGSRSEMCGNGIRCVAKYAYERGLARRNPLRVQTDRGVLTLELFLDGSRVTQVRVDMGEPILEPSRIPARFAGQRVIDAPLAAPESAGGPPELRVTAVSMGNPHAVFFEPDISRVPLLQWGPALETHPQFPQRVNVHFVQVVRPDYVKMITWERGTGPTQACGTGASAVCVAGVLTGRSARSVTALLPGGELRIEWDAATNHVFKTGPATDVFDGVWPD